MYTIHMIRRDRTKRRVGEQLEDEEGGRHGHSRGHTSTYRPETDEVSPPQYRAVDPDATTIIFPNRARHSIYSVDSNDASSDRPLLATIATTVITLRSEPLPATGETIEMDTTVTGPVITAPLPALSLANHRQPGLVYTPSPGSGASSATGNVSRASSTSSSTPSSSSSPQNSRPTSPSTEVVSQLDRFHRTVPTLNRLRSEGPPPYIPPAPEQSLPQLPPEYNAVSSLTST
ncbi:hypothetical protein BGZ81_010732 [Podila clonocystis]|nr:hypothetical protein BGZ81_010732 [Podila clonocystis]